MLNVGVRQPPYFKPKFHFAHGQNGGHGNKPKVWDHSGANVFERYCFSLEDGQLKCSDWSPVRVSVAVAV